MTDDTQWTDWIDWNGGECPIPHVKRGDWEAQFSHESEPSRMDGPPKQYAWSPNGVGISITKYRYRPRKPPVDWKGIADELATALDKADEELASIPYRKSQWPRPKISDAIARYREAIK